MFSVRQKKTSFKIRERAEVFGTKQDKLKASQFYATFFPVFPKAPTEVGKGWMDSWDSAVVVPSDLLSEADLPFTLEYATNLFHSIASGVSVSRPNVSATIIAYIREYEPLISCLPVKRFLASTVASEFGVPMTNLHPLKKDLLEAEHQRRLALLSALCHFSSQLAMRVLSDQLASPSAFEGGVKNCIGGYSGTLAFACITALRDFCEARVALRKSAFRNPHETYSLRMIRASPFSKELFDKGEKSTIEQDFGKFVHKNLSWESFLDVKVQPSTSQPKQKASPKQSWRGRQSPRGRGRGFSGSSYRGKGGPFKSSGGGNGQSRGQKFRQGNQSFSRGRGGRRN